MKPSWGAATSPLRSFWKESLSLASRSKKRHEILWKKSALSLSYSDVTRTAGTGRAKPPPPPESPETGPGDGGRGESAGEAAGSGGASPATVMAAAARNAGFHLFVFFFRISGLLGRDWGDCEMVGLLVGLNFSGPFDFIIFLKNKKLIPTHNPSIISNNHP